MLVKKYYFISIDGSDSNSNNLFMLFKFNLLALFDRKYQQVMGSNSVYGSNQYFGLKFLKKLNTSRPPTVIQKKKFFQFLSRFGRRWAARISRLFSCGLVKNTFKGLFLALSEQKRNAKNKHNKTKMSLLIKIGLYANKNKPNAEKSVGIMAARVVQLTGKNL